MLRLLTKSPFARAPSALPRLSNFRFNTNISKHTTNADTAQVKAESPEIETSTEEIPWYLRDDITSDLVETKKIELPEIPTHAPPQVEEFINLLAHDYGMDDLLLFDMTLLPEEHEFKETNKNIDFVIISTGKSEKHIYKAANELRLHLKHTYNTVPLIEGMVSNAKTPAMRRRLLRRARKGPLATDNDYGRAANSWVMCSHEGIDVHMLTGPRREDLNLESLWCAPEDLHKYTSNQTTSQESDNIFSGIRRFHTMTNFRRHYSNNSSNLEAYLYQLNSKAGQLNTDEITLLKNMFEDTFQNASLRDHEVRFQFWKSLHLANPELFTFQDAEDALLAKYASVNALTDDLSLQKLNDVAEYAKLLLDTPSRAHDKPLSDVALDKLSKFIAALYEFSTDKFTLSGNPLLIPLLWRLCYHEHQNVRQLSPGTVDAVIHSGQPIEVCEASPLITIASKNARDVLSLVDYFTQKVDFGTVPTYALSELILFTYGNASKWGKFWNQWEDMCFSKSVEPDVAVERWTRLAVYLSCRGDKSSMRSFLLNYWSASNSVGGSFVKAFEANGNTFNSERESSALRRAILSMVNSFDGDQTFDGIRNQVESICK
ncbi:CIC11C00000000585 [Sungouiella intermedia]|uniref:ATPase synthesis protein 25 n=1 Tax=Sungouiella intermedia TaxID=45354 RepID=A0A1L0CVX6_9ASCO|nr:CIC11C00000000585 [[Candida] intermedia]